LKNFDDPRNQVLGILKFQLDLSQLAVSSLKLIKSTRHLSRCAFKLCGSLSPPTYIPSVVQMQFTQANSGLPISNHCDLKSIEGPLSLFVCYTTFARLGGVKCFKQSARVFKRGLKTFP
jgi:hypothetical protein